MSDKPGYRRPQAGTQPDYLHPAYQSTNLRHLSPGTRLNIETDVLAKYAAQLTRRSEDWLTAGYLLARGY